MVSPTWSGCSRMPAVQTQRRWIQRSKKSREIALHKHFPSRTSRIPSDTGCGKEGREPQLRQSGLETKLIQNACQNYENLHLTDIDNPFCHSQKWIWGVNAKVEVLDGSSFKDLSLVGRIRLSGWPHIVITTCADHRWLCLFSFRCVFSRPYSEGD